MHEDFEHLVDHTEMIMPLELLPYVHQIFVQRIETPRENF